MQVLEFALERNRASHAMIADCKPMRFGIDTYNVSLFFLNYFLRTNKSARFMMLVFYNPHERYIQIMRIKYILCRTHLPGTTINDNNRRKLPFFVTKTTPQHFL